jgi:hypothetical protein
MRRSHNNMKVMIIYPWARCAFYSSNASILCLANRSVIYTSIISISEMIDKNIRDYCELAVLMDNFQLGFVCFQYSKDHITSTIFDVCSFNTST